MGSYRHRSAIDDDHGLILRGNQFETLDYPGALFTRAYSINNHGHIAGTYKVDDQFNGFIDRDGEFQSLHFPGSVATLVFGINDAGVVVGSYFDAPYHSNAFVWIDGRYIRVHSGFPVTNLSSINNEGEITGRGGTAGTVSFIYRYGEFQQLHDAPGWVVGGINGRGDITGTTPSGESYIATGCRNPQSAITFRFYLLHSVSTVGAGA